MHLATLTEGYGTTFPVSPIGKVFFFNSRLKSVPYPSVPSVGKAEAKAGASFSGLGKKMNPSVGKVKAGGLGKK
jgi:hypothetical protein